MSEFALRTFGNKENSYCHLSLWKDPCEYVQPLLEGSCPHTHSFICSPSPHLLLFRSSMSLRSSSIRNVLMTIWRRLTATATQQPSWAACVAVRSRSRWCPLATRCTFASFLTPQYKGRASKLHTQQVCVCDHMHIFI